MQGGSKAGILRFVKRQGEPPNLFPALRFSSCAAPFDALRRIFQHNAARLEFIADTVGLFEIFIFAGRLPFFNQGFDFFVVRARSSGFSMPKTPHSSLRMPSAATRILL